MVQTYEELHEFIKTDQPNICQISCYKDGKEVYTDEWNDYKKEDACHVMSVTKGIVALLVGIAIDKGYIESIDQHVLDFFPDYQIKRGEKTIQQVTLRHLMTMTAPFKYRSDPWTKVCSSDDWTIAALDFLGGRKGLTGEFKYSTLGVHILTGIISKVSGKKIVDFANEYLFEPIGVKPHRNYLALTETEHKQFTISHEPKENVWFCDPQGVGAAGYGLCFSATDLAKIGQLCLDKGVHEGRSLVSASWLETITKSTHQCGPEFGYMQYGYLWWILNQEGTKYAALGNSGNVLYINEEANVVVTVTAYFKPRIFDRVDFIQKYIEPFLGVK